MNNLLDIYLFIEKMKSIIGNGCKIYISTSPYQSLIIKAEWLTNETIYHCVRHFSFMEMKDTADINILADYFCQAAIQEYKKVTESGK